MTDPDWYRAAASPQALQVVPAGQHQLHGDAASSPPSSTRRATARTCSGTSGAAAGTPSRRAAPRSPTPSPSPRSRTIRGASPTLVNLLRDHGIEVSRAKESVTVKDGTFPAGTYLVRLDQPYRSFALDLLLPQKYPADKALYPAYDDVSFALSVSFGVEVKPIEDPAVRQIATSLVTAPVAYKGTRRERRGRLPRARLGAGSPSRGPRAPGQVQGRGRREVLLLGGHRVSRGLLGDPLAVEPSFGPRGRRVRAGSSTSTRPTPLRACRATPSICPGSPSSRPGTTPRGRAGCG